MTPKLNTSCNNPIDISSSIQEILEKCGGKVMADGTAMVNCPAHDDTNPSLHVTDDNGQLLLYCFAGCPQETVIQAMKDKGLWPSKNGNRLPPGIFPTWDKGAKRLTSLWYYKDYSGTILGCVARYDSELLGKSIIPYFKKSGSKWKSGAAPKPRPLYGLHELARNTGLTILIAEGEKAAEAARGLVGMEYVCMTWPGGSNAVEQADFSPLSGREVIICPDADSQGEKAALVVAENCQKAGAKNVCVVTPPNDVENGWDLADAIYDGWTREQVQQWIANNAKTVEQDPEESQQESIMSLPSFPLNVMPDYFQAPIQQAVKAFSVPPEVPAATLLSLVGALIGRSRAVVVKSGWTEHPNLYIVIVAPSGMGKSPCVRTFMKSIFREEKRRFDEFQQALAQYQEEMNVRRRMKQNELGPPPEKPTWKQIYVEDATEEALTDALSANAKGILWYVDEISGLIMNLGRYRNDGKSDGPKARLMSAYDSGPWKRTRKSGDNAFISHACLSILGTLQPALLPNLFADIDAASGFLPRFIFVRAEPSGPPLWTDESFDGEYRERIDQLVGDLMSREMGEEPAYVGLTKEAQSLYREWYNEQAREPWVNFDAQQYEALSAKLRGQCARLALILHVLECHAQGMDDTQPIQPATMERALILANWIKAHQRHIWQALAQPEQISQSSPIEKRIATAIADLEGEISEGKLPISRITEQVNNGAEKAYQVKPETVGKGLKKIGLHSSKGTGGKRLVHISDQKLESLKQTASPATTATFSEMTRSAGGWHVQENRHYCHQGPKEGMAGVAGEKALPLSGNPHESRESGRCGSSGRSEGTENKLDFNNAKSQRAKI
ncbi:DUF3987 domain-containing protein [Desulfovermiculus halophilus]|uniref:DUF3987 domain-containing protein n=1 Tax=Desulfovermiculus halophilus TaxID=339722 RepID=UPI0004896D01|nr:DUF3987 domain-containing protein [Desulfovermiculus halophilus]